MEKKFKLGDIVRTKIEIVDIFGEHEIGAQATIINCFPNVPLYEIEFDNGGIVGIAEIYLDVPSE